MQEQEWSNFIASVSSMLSSLGAPPHLQSPWVYLASSLVLHHLNTVLPFSQLRSCAWRDGWPETGWSVLTGTRTSACSRLPLDLCLMKECVPLFAVKLYFQFLAQKGKVWPSLRIYQTWNQLQDVMSPSRVRSGPKPQWNQYVISFLQPQRNLIVKE